MYWVDSTTDNKLFCPLVSDEGHTNSNNGPESNDDDELKVNMQQQDESEGGSDELEEDLAQNLLNGAVVQHN